MREIGQAKESGGPLKCEDKGGVAPSMPSNQNRKPFLNAANKTAYFFDDGMTDEEAYRALLDPRHHVEMSEMFDSGFGDLYRVVHVSAQPNS